MKQEKQEITADQAAQAVVNGVLAASLEVFTELQRAVRADPLWRGDFPDLPDGASREFSVMSFMLENESLTNHFEPHMAARLSELSFEHAADALAVSLSNLSAWYSEYAEPYRFDLSVPTDPFTPFGFLGIFGRRVGLPGRSIPGVPGELHITSIGASMLAAVLIRSVGTWKKVKELYEVTV